MGTKGFDHAHGTAEIRTERLLLRRCRPEDAETLYLELGTDPAFSRYSGWNPYATPEMARETVQRFIEGYGSDRAYSWILDCGGRLVGTIGAYDFECDRIEVGLSIIRSCWGQGYATEALRAVLVFLTEQEGIACVTAWCAGENTGSMRAMEKAGMVRTAAEKDALEVCGKTYDKHTYEYRAR